MSDPLGELTLLASAFRKVLADGLIALRTEVDAGAHPANAARPRVLVRTNDWVELSPAEAAAVERAYARAMAE